MMAVGQKFLIHDRRDPYFERSYPPTFTPKRPSCDLFWGVRFTKVIPDEKDIDNAF